MPSMVNYPEPNTNEGISEMGFDKTGARYKLEAPSKKVQYALGWRTSETSAEFAVNNPAYWNAFESNTTEIEKTTASSEFYQLRLNADHVYKLIGFVSILEAPPSRIYRGFRWYNTTTGASLGLKEGLLMEQMALMQGVAVELLLPI